MKSTRKSHLHYLMPKSLLFLISVLFQQICYTQISGVWKLLSIKQIQNESKIAFKSNGPILQFDSSNNLTVYESGALHNEFVSDRSFGYREKFSIEYLQKYLVIRNHHNDILFKGTYKISKNKLQLTLTDTNFLTYKLTKINFKKAKIRDSFVDSSIIFRILKKRQNPKELQLIYLSKNNRNKLVLINGSIGIRYINNNNLYDISALPLYIDSIKNTLTLFPLSIRSSKILTCSYLSADIFFPTIELPIDQIQKIYYVSKNSRRQIITGSVITYTGIGAASAILMFQVIEVMLGYCTGNYSYTDYTPAYIFSAALTSAGLITTLSTNNHYYISNDKNSAYDWHLEYRKLQNTKTN